MSFINDDYEFGNPSISVIYRGTSDLLWDDSSLEGACCTAPGLSWLNKVFQTDYIELRVCGDESLNWFLVKAYKRSSTIFLRHIIL